MQTCKSCDKFWPSAPQRFADSNAVDMGAPRQGQCRLQLVSAMFPAGNGGAIIMADYATVAEDFPACSHHPDYQPPAKMDTLEHPPFCPCDGCKQQRRRKSLDLAA
jgi:hypothetical protein